MFKKYAGNNILDKIDSSVDFQRLDNAVRQVLTVSKEELLKQEQRGLLPSSLIVLADRSPPPVTSATAIFADYIWTVA